jgi:hypothetical protein
MNTAKKSRDAEVPVTVRLAGIAVRTLFISILAIITASVASPQMEHVSSLFETPSDLIRVALGLVVCAWLVVHVFILPKDPNGYRTWLYPGAAILPLAALCALIVW